MSGGPAGVHVYKYLPFDPADAFRLKQMRDLVVESALYLSAPSDFNDPYDFRARILVNENAEHVRKHFEKSARRLLNEGEDPIPHVLGKSKKVDVLASRAMAKLIANPDFVTSSFFAARDKNGVFCFSEDPRGILMWAHYAWGHKGICLQFDVSRDPGVLMFSHRVAYRDELPTIIWPVKGNELVDKVIFSKGSAWKSEKEVRYVSVRMVRDSLHFDGCALRGIILGSRFPSKNLSVINDLIGERLRRGLPMPALYQAREDQENYGIFIARHEARVSS